MPTITRIATMIAVLLWLSACGASNTEDSASPVVPPDTAAPTTTTAPDPTTTGGVPVEHLEAIKNHFRELNEAWKSGGARNGYQVSAERAYPEGGWSAADLVCLDSKKAAGQVPPGWDLEIFYAQMDLARPTNDQILDEDSIEPDPGWVVPPPGPGSGSVPEGAIYILETTQSGGEISQGHVVVEADGEVRWFPIPCP